MAFAAKIPAYPTGPHPGFRMPLDIGAQNATPETAHAKNALSFTDLIDVINPLQHIPVLSSIYRHISGDEINAPAKIAGGALFGGVIGLAASIADAVLDKLTGADTGEHVMMAMLGKGKHSAPDPVTVAANEHEVSETRRGKVTARPIGAAAPQPLDTATFNALAATLGGPEALAHLAPKPVAANQEKLLDKNPSPGAVSYADALLRMRQGLDRYTPIAPDKAISTD